MTHHPDLQAIRAKLRSLQEDDVSPPIIEPDWQTPQQRLAERAATDAAGFSFALAANVESSIESAEQTLAHQQANAIAALQRRSKQGQSFTNGIANGLGNVQDDRQTSLQISIQPTEQAPILPVDAAHTAPEQTIAEAVAQHAAWKNRELAQTTQESARPAAQSAPVNQAASAQPPTERSYASNQPVNQTVNQAVTNPAATPPELAQAAAQRWQQSYQKIQLQIQQINQLAQAQETAIRDLRILSEVAAHWQRVMAEDQGVPSHQVVLPFCWSKQPLGVPVIQQNEQGQWLVQTRLIDLLQAERDAEAMATQLRHRQLRSRPHRAAQPLGLRLLRWLRFLQQLLQQQWQRRWQHYSKQLGLAPSPRRAARASSRASGFSAPSSPTASSAPVKESNAQAQPQSYQPQWSNPMNTQPSMPPPRSSSPFQMPEFSLLDISIWITGAAIARVGLNWMLANLPFTAPAVIGLILVVTGWAVYRATMDSELTLTLGYRALLLMIGLLLGGAL